MVKGQLIAVISTERRNINSILILLCSNRDNWQLFPSFHCVTNLTIDNYFPHFTVFHSGWQSVTLKNTAARIFFSLTALKRQRCECPSNPSLGNLPKTLIVGDGKKKAKRCHFDGREKYKLFPSFHCVPFGMTGSHSNKSAARMYLLLSHSLWQRWEGLFEPVARKTY